MGRRGGGGGVGIGEWLGSEKSSSYSTDFCSMIGIVGGSIIGDLVDSDRGEGDGGSSIIGDLIDSDSEGGDGDCSS